MPVDDDKIMDASFTDHDTSYNECDVIFQTRFVGVAFPDKTYVISFRREYRREEKPFT